jgi:hypothetical protein
MLTDAQVVKMRKDKKYIKLTNVGLKQFATDLIKSGVDDLRPDITSVQRFVSKITKKRIIRSELHKTSCDILERLINKNLQWPRKPSSICDICEDYEGQYLWLRYDEPRVQSVFRRAKFLITDAEIRLLIKNYSRIGNNNSANNRLLELQKELDDLNDKTVKDIQEDFLAEIVSKMDNKKFYKDNAKKIIEGFKSMTNLRRVENDK